LFFIDFFPVDIVCREIEKDMPPCPQIDVEFESALQDRGIRIKDFSYPKTALCQLISTHLPGMKCRVTVLIGVIKPPGIVNQPILLF
jgi:hypothetical protein